MAEQPSAIPPGAMIRCRCGVVVATIRDWRKHLRHHGHSISWEFIDKQDGKRLYD